MKRTLCVTVLLGTLACGSTPPATSGGLSGNGGTTSGTIGSTTSGGQGGTTSGAAACNWAAQILPLGDGGTGSADLAMLVPLLFDGGGPPAIVALDLGDDTLDVAPGAGGAYSAFTHVSLDIVLADGGLLSAVPVGLAAVDLDGDHRADLVFSSQSLGAIGVLLGRGDGTFSTAVYYATDDAGTCGTFCSGALPANPVVGDFNNDGQPDVAVANLLDGTVAVLYGGDGGAGQALGTLLAPKLIPMASGLMTPIPQELAAADFNRDGNLDLVVKDDGNWQLDYIPGEGAAGFGSPLVFNAGYSAGGQLAVAYLRGPDVGPDLIAGNTANPAVSMGANTEPSIDVFLGLGDGGFQPAIKLTDSAGRFFNNGLGFDGVVVADLDGDGIPDLLGSFEDRGTGQTEIAAWIQGGANGVGDGTFSESPRVQAVNTDANTTSLSVAPLAGAELILTSGGGLPYVSVGVAAWACY